MKLHADFDIGFWAFGLTINFVPKEREIAISLGPLYLAILFYDE